MKKFAFLLHFRSDYRTELRTLARPLGWLPERFYRSVFRRLPFAPFVWGTITVTPDATEPEGYVIMLPYSGDHLLQQQDEVISRIEQGLRLSSALGAEIVGLGAQTSTVTLDGRLLTTNPYTSITSGNSFTAVTLWQQVFQLINQLPDREPVVAVVGATGSTGSLLCQLMTVHQPSARYVLVDRHERRLQDISTLMTSLNNTVKPQISRDMDQIRKADLVVCLSGSDDHQLQASQLKPGAVVLYDVNANGTAASLCEKRPDVLFLAGGLVSLPHLQLGRGLGLPNQMAFASLAETMLLALVGREGHFSIGQPTLEQADYLLALAQQFSNLGFWHAWHDNLDQKQKAFPLLPLIAAPLPYATAWLQPKLPGLMGLD
ncbi:shikimate dehydrogenase [Larkinella insperata]|uniref:Shikimate dehydrogenase n=1 Tax=Larkinella insperata TaxID=332158 RepID=A0ABW3Q710_9BACT